MRAVDPANLENGSYNRDRPYCDKERNADGLRQYDQADRSIGACNEHEDHGVVNLAQHPVDALRNVKGVVDRACTIQADHTDDKDNERSHIRAVHAVSCFC